jgi:hypothetical protein
MKRAAKKSRKAITYEQACKTMALMDFWTIEDAAALLIGAIPRGLSRRKLTGTKAHTVARVTHTLSGADCVVNPESPVGRYRVPPREIVEWARRKSNDDVPSELVTAVLGAARDGEQAKRSMHQSTFRRERCRAIAALLWQQDNTKHLTLEAMVQRPELLEIGCDGKQYQLDTIKEWIKEQNPNRRPGRRPHKN